MFESIKRTVSAVAAAAIIAGAITVLHGANDKVVASAPLHGGKGDRIDIRATGLNCSEQAWPYYEASCVKDRRHPMSQAKPARTVTVDRVSVVR
jgi:hypothetical protein